ncbi:MAG: hypothetical protein U9N41_01740 [Euryarchaeota archaeon]|nr:hypothetical protein [Euryarchaeota archaeon]
MERTRNPFLERKALPTTFLPSVKTLTKNILFVFLLAQTFSLKEKLYQKNYFLSTGSFSKRKCFVKKKKCCVI